MLFDFKGVSVLEMVHAFEEASGVKIPVEMAGRRAGDVASSYATCDLAEKEMGFKCKYTLFDMCKCPKNINPSRFEYFVALFVTMIRSINYMLIFLFQAKIHGPGNQKTPTDLLKRNDFVTTFYMRARYVRSHLLID